MDINIFQKEIDDIKNRLSKCSVSRRDEKNIKLFKLNSSFRGKCSFCYNVPPEDDKKYEGFVDSDFGIRMAFFFYEEDVIRIYIAPRFFNRIHNKSLPIKLAAIYVHELNHRLQRDNKPSFFFNSKHKVYLKDPVEIESFAFETALMCYANRIKSIWLYNRKYYLIIAHKVSVFEYYYREYFKNLQLPDPVFYKYINLVFKFLKKVEESN